MYTDPSFRTLEQTRLSVNHRSNIDISGGEN